MDFSAISAFFDQSVPIGIVFIVVYLVRMGRDIKHIQKDLSNHITDTNKKIDNLRQETNSRFDNLRQETNSRFDRLSDRFDKLSDRFNKLYEWLIQDKAKKQSSQQR